MMWSSGYSLIDLSLDYLFNLLSTGLEHDPLQDERLALPEVG